MTNEELVKSLTTMVQEFVSTEIGKLRKEFSELPQPKDGAPGADGKDGKDGKDGVDGAPGANGKDGKDGSDGAPGQNGINGEDGKDAVAIDILPAIDESKCYARGTYATHKGGLWRSFEKTKGMRGWECIVDGIESASIEYDGERKCVMQINRSSGAMVEKEMVMPIVIDRGVYNPEKSYALNDGVTYAGSYWLAVKDAPQGTPGASDDFRLAVKKGRDYKQPVKAQ